MLNQSEVKVTSATTRKTILVAEEMAVAFSCKVSDSGVSTTDDKKVVKAGTPLAGDLTARETAFTVAADGTGAVGLLLHDVDVTSGTKNAQVLVFGFVDVSKLESDVASMVQAAKLPKITLEIGRAHV